MAKLKTRTNQPVSDSEGLLDYVAQNGKTTEVGGNLEVDGNLKVNGEIEGDLIMEAPVNIFTILGLTPVVETGIHTYPLSYTIEQVFNILLKYRTRGIAYGPFVLQASQIYPEEKKIYFNYLNASIPELDAYTIIDISYQKVGITDNVSLFVNYQEL